MRNGSGSQKGSRKKKGQTKRAIRKRKLSPGTAFENALEGLFLLDVTAEGRFKIGGSSTAGVDLTGLSTREGVGKYVEEVVPESIAEEIIANCRRCLEARTTVYYETHATIQPGIRHFSTALTPVEDGTGTICRIVGVVREIAETKQAEGNIRRSEERFRVAFSNANEGICLVNPDGRFLQVNKAMSDILGYSGDELERMHLWDITHPDDRDITDLSVSRILKGEVTKTSFEKRYIHKDGHIVWGNVSTSLVYNPSGRPLHFITHIQNITEKKRAEDALRQSEERYRNLVTISPDALYVHVGRRVTFANPAMCRLLGARDPLELIGKSVFEIVHPDYHALVLERWNLVSQGEIAPLIEEKFVRLDGGVVDVEVNAVAIGPPDRMEVQVIARDITERKRSQRKLKESEERYREFVESMPDGVYRSTHAGRFLEVNPAMVKILGYESKDDLLAIDIPSQLYITPTDRESAALTEKLEEMAVFPLKKKDGSIIWVEDHGRHVVDKEGNVLFHEGILRDVSERIQADEALRRSEARFRGYFELPLVGIAVISPGKSWIEINDRMCKMLGYSREELSRIPWSQITHPEDLEHDIRLFDDVLEGRSDGYSLDKRFIRKNGEVVWVSLAARCVRRESGAVDYFVSVFQDITERKRGEEQVLASLHEKELLLKEIHHRVKNNMQVISSLLSIQATESEDPKIREAFIESQHRVRSMALVHEKLYRSADLARIDFGEYLSAVTAELARMSKVGGVTCRVEAERVFLGIDIAIPCGLIVNELVTNSLKHAFTGKEKGTVVVKLRRLDALNVELVVKDDGIGFPIDRDFRRTTSMGMTIIVSLTTQLSGTISLVKDGGSQFIVSFPG